MPHLHVQYSSEGQTPDGRRVRFSPPLALIQHGPHLQVSVTVADVVAQQLASRGEGIPPPVAGLALVDTGANVTAIDDTAARNLGIPAVDVVRMTTASHADHECNVYPTRISLIGTPLSIDCPRTIGANLAPQGLLLLIGRDILQHWTLFYNGAMGQITLSF